MLKYERQLKSPGPTSHYTGVSNIISPQVLLPALTYSPLMGLPHKGINPTLCTLNIQKE